MNKVLYTIILVSILSSTLFIFTKRGHTLKCELPHKTVRDTIRHHITKTEPLFTYDYGNGDTSCFELIKDSLSEGGVDIRIRCVCSCEEYKKKKL
jgi:hypothetical protein